MILVPQCVTLFSLCCSSDKPVTGAPPRNHISPAKGNLLGLGYARNQPGVLWHRHKRALPPHERAVIQKHVIYSQLAQEHIAMTYVPGTINATVHAGCKHFVRYPYAGDFKSEVHIWCVPRRAQYCARKDREFTAGRLTAASCAHWLDITGAAQTVDFTTFGSNDCSSLEITNIDFAEAGRCVGFENTSFSSFQTITNTRCAAGESVFLHLSVGSCGTDLDVVGSSDPWMACVRCVGWGDGNRLYLQQLPRCGHFSSRSNNCLI